MQIPIYSRFRFGPITDQAPNVKKKGEEKLEGGIREQSADDPDGHECPNGTSRGVHGNDFGEFRWFEGRLWDKKYSSVARRTRFLPIC